MADCRARRPLSTAPRCLIVSILLPLILEPNWRPDKLIPNHIALHTSFVFKIETKNTRNLKHQNINWFAGLFKFHTVSATQKAKGHILKSRYHAVNSPHQVSIQRDSAQRQQGAQSTKSRASGESCAHSTTKQQVSSQIMHYLLK